MLTRRDQSILTKTLANSDDERDFANHIVFNRLLKNHLNYIVLNYCVIFTVEFDDILSIYFIHFLLFMCGNVLYSDFIRYVDIVVLLTNHIALCM